MASSNCNRGSSASSMASPEMECSGACGMEPSHTHVSPDEWMKEPVSTWAEGHMQAPLCYVCVPRDIQETIEEEGFQAQRRHNIAVSLTRTAASSAWAVKGGVGEFTIFAVLEDPDRYSMIPSLDTVDGHSLVFPLDTAIHIPPENMYRVMGTENAIAPPCREDEAMNIRRTCLKA